MPAPNPATDVVNANVLALGLSPAVSMAAVYQSMSHSLGILYENAVANQKIQSIAADAVLVEGLVQGLANTAIDVVEDVAAAADPVAELAALLKALNKGH
ncbi:R body protein RebB-like protein [Roseibium polysiphoniae]|uniref:R body protein RebB-like protein n=1 Tax=Roseibium polysiphoniae TaxID=2571221 RepID=A0A944CC06_9HYPH|nr:RebB family R body protein [Roseibium polysiphoniae]MBS8260278.1 R body protein RebB-like protein [Roseibium polysiphoniae]